MFPTACSCKPRSASLRASATFSEGHLSIVLISHVVLPSKAAVRRSRRSARRELVRTDIVLLALAPFARGDPQDALEDALSSLCTVSWPSTIVPQLMSMSSSMR